jgi:hypothetical protein
MSPQVNQKLMTSRPLHSPPLVKASAIVRNASVVPIGRSFDRFAADPRDLSNVHQLALFIAGLGKPVKKPGYCSYGLIEQCFVGIFTLLVSSTCLNSLATSHIFVLGSPPFGFIILSLLAGASASAMVDG